MGGGPPGAAFHARADATELQKQGLAQRLSADLIEQGDCAELGDLLVQSQTRRGQKRFVKADRCWKVE